MSETHPVLISVIMSVFNGERYLEEAIKSILNQTFEDFEFIIINDGSTDQSLKMIQKYAQQDSRIKWVSRENLGLVKSLNEAIGLSQGKYIARMDADDIALDKRLEKQFQFLESKPDIGVCGTWVKVFGVDLDTKVWRLPTCDKDLKASLIFSVPFAHPTVMYRKNLIDKNKVFYNADYKNAEDYKFWVDLSRFTAFANLPEALLMYRYHPQSVSRQADKAIDDHRYNVISSIQDELVTAIGVKMGNEEKLLNFIVATNQRVLENDISLLSVRAFFNKLIEANKQSKYLSNGSVKILLSRRFFVLVILDFKKSRRLDLKQMMSILFLLGGFYTLRKFIVLSRL